MKTDENGWKHFKSFEMGNTVEYNWQQLKTIENEFMGFPNTEFPNF